MISAEPRVRVELGARGYDVVAGVGILDRLGALVIKSGAGRRGGRAMLISDEGLPRTTVAAAMRSLAQADLDVSHLRLPATEADKSLATAHKIVLEMARARMDRSEPLITLGGGIIGDLAGFAAAIYRRGVPVVQCPTTLLSMVDASVGGKTGVNLAVGEGPGSLKKNMVGAFHQPRLVAADVDTLTSLADRPFRAGLAECIKHGMIAGDWGDPGLLDWTIQAIPAALARDSATLTELVMRNVAVKAAVVGRDEREEAPQGGRALLNLGHTFAHAIETLPSLSPDGDLNKAPLQHGEAVALGLVAAARCAAAPWTALLR
jgi:3-dehydroquinate synthetase